MKYLRSLISIFVLFLILFSLWGFYSALRPNKIHSVITPADLLIPYEKVSFRTQDNILLKGWFIRNADPKAKTIILLHGYPADKGNILSAMAFLYHDYNILLFDFRSLGESDGYFTTVGVNEVLDLQAAITYLQIQGINEVGVWGFSLGGAVALMATPTTPAIKAIVAQSPYARLDWMVEEYYHMPILKYPLTWLTRLWGIIFLQADFKSISPAQSSTNITVPVLIIHSLNDQFVTNKHLLLFEKKLSNHSNVSFAIFEGQHGEFMENNQQIVSDFFHKNL